MQARLKGSTSDKPARSAPRDRKKSARELAVGILTRVEERDAYADILLESALRAEGLEERERALLTQLVYGTLRWRGALDWRLERGLRAGLAGTEPQLRNLLRVALYQLAFLSRVPDYAAVNEAVTLAKRIGGAKKAALVNAVLRAILRDEDRFALPDRERDETAYLAVRWSHPEWLVRMWRDYIGQAELEPLLEANNEEAPLVVRVNRLKASREAVLERLGGLGSPTRYAPQGVRLRGIARIGELPGFSAGLYQVQGEASQLVGFLLDPKPGERVLDACAAPGGKATHLAELMGDSGEVVAADISERGLEKLRGSARRLGLKAVRAVRHDMTEPLPATWRLRYDRVLVDAPCSGLGTLRSHPEVKWRRSPADIARLAELQKKMLREAVGALKPGGVLVYATCTLSRAENESVVEALLEEGRLLLEGAAPFLPAAARSMVRGGYFFSLPHRHDTDGFFAARMRKTG